MLVRFAYLAVAHAFAVVRLLPMTDREKDVEILALRHQLSVLQRQLGGQRPQLRPEDRAFLAALLLPLSRATLRRLQLLVSPDTVLRWHRDLVKHRHARASVNQGPGRPRTLTSIRRLVLRLAAENPSWGYRRIHGELALLGIKIAPSTVWEILKSDGVHPAPQRTTVTWADFLRSQSEAILAMDFIETVTLTGQRQYILAAPQLLQMRHVRADRGISQPGRRPGQHEPGQHISLERDQLSQARPGNARHAGPARPPGSPGSPRLHRSSKIITGDDRPAKIPNSL